MSNRTAGLLLLLLLATAFACACDGDGDDPSPTDSVPTGPAALSERIQLEEGVSRLAAGAFSTGLVPGAVSSFDPILLPLEGQREPPPCEDFVFAFAWQVREATPAEGLVWRINEDGTAREIGSGASGTASAGCGIVESVNNGGEMVTLDVHYVIGQRE